MFAVVRIPHDGPLQGIVQKVLNRHEFHDHDYCILFRETPLQLINIAIEIFCRFSPQPPSAHPYFFSAQRLDRFHQCLFMTAYPERINRVLVKVYSECRRHGVSGKKRRVFNPDTHTGIWNRMAASLIEVQTFLYLARPLSLILCLIIVLRIGPEERVFRGGGLKRPS